jgi:hypothetical protein
MMKGIAEAAKKKVVGQFSKDEDGSLVRLKISTVSAKGSNESSKTYEVFLNPNQLTHNIKINVSKPDTINQSKTEDNTDTPNASSTNNSTAGSSNGDTANDILKVLSIDPEKLNFTLMLDGTGASGVLTNVAAEIEKLATITYKQSVAQQKRLNIIWGDTISFNGYLESFDVNYTLFKPSGAPLRATVALSFIGESGLTDLPTDDFRQSNTKEIDIDDAKTIVNMCSMVYNNPGAYIAVAKANKLTNVRQLKPGSKLSFPPKKS